MGVDPAKERPSARRRPGHQMADLPVTAKGAETLPDKTANAIADAHHQQWRDENQGALDDANTFLTRYGLWSDGRRQFSRCDHIKHAYAPTNARRTPSGSPLIARSNVRAGPLGRLAPRSHSCTVRTLNS